MRGATILDYDDVIDAQNFNPRSPCGERPCRVDKDESAVRISIHAPHAGSDPARQDAHAHGQDFNPRSPCGERLDGHDSRADRGRISIHAPHAGSDGTGSEQLLQVRISIHAPHAGSDAFRCPPRGARLHFNPRSPCGERRRYNALTATRSSFQSTLPMRGATAAPHVLARGIVHFNPRSPCGERPLHSVR